MANSRTFFVRPACLDDGKQIGQLIYDTVHTVNRQDYSEEQVKVWVPDPLIYSTYEESYAYVAELEGTVTGFANMTSNGYLHRFYVHKDFQGQRIGSRLLEALEMKARTLQLKEVYTEASITAKPFFEAKGYIVIMQQVITLYGVC